MLCGVALASSAPGRAAYTTAYNDGERVNVMSKYYVNNNQWGYKINGWGGGSQSVGADPVANTGYWRTDFNWYNNNVAWDQYHIKAFPSIVEGWQWGYARTDHGNLPRPINWNSNVWTTWSYSTSGVPGWAKWDAIYDMWLDWNDTPSGTPSEEIMVFLNYTADTTPTDGYQGDVNLAGNTWSVYRSNTDRQVISYVAKNKTTYFSGNLRDFINHASYTKGWINTSKQLLSVQAGFEIWYGQGYFQTWGYNCDVG